MKHQLFPLLCLALFALSACKTDPQKQAADALLQEATQQAEQGNYRRAIFLIDSLRHAYPDQVEARRQALTLYQEASLKEAQASLALTDSALQATSREYEQMKREVESHKAANNATADELTRLTRLRMHRDSLQVKFDVECAKIKYIHKRQKQ